MSGSPEEVKHHVAIYKKVAFALALLTITTVGASFLPVAVPVAIVIALIIATTKGTLVASFFMHLVHERSNALVFALALTVVFWFVLMLGAALHDQRPCRRALDAAERRCAGGARGRGPLMSLRSFHLVFIIASILLALMMAVWGGVTYGTERGSIWHLATALGSVVTAGLLVAYFVTFIRKTRELGLR